jgi:hypothetical protein
MINDIDELKIFLKELLWEGLDINVNFYSVIEDKHEIFLIEYNNHVVKIDNNGNIKNIKISKKSVDN